MTGGNIHLVNCGLEAFNWSPGDPDGNPFYYGEGMNISGGTLDIRMLVLNASSTSGAINVTGGTVTAGGLIFRHYGASTGSGASAIFGNQTTTVYDLKRSNSGILNVTSAMGRIFINHSDLNSGVDLCKIYQYPGSYPTIAEQP